MSNFELGRMLHDLRTRKAKHLLWPLAAAAAYGLTSAGKGPAAEFTNGTNATGFLLIVTVLAILLVRRRTAVVPILRQTLAARRYRKHPAVHHVQIGRVSTFTSNRLWRTIPWILALALFWGAVLLVNWCGLLAAQHPSLDPDALLWAVGCAAASLALLMWADLLRNWRLAWNLPGFAANVPDPGAAGWYCRLEGSARDLWWYGWPVAVGFAVSADRSMYWAAVIGVGCAFLTTNGRNYVNGFVLNRAVAPESQDGSPAPAAAAWSMYKDMRALEAQNETTAFFRALAIIPAGSFGMLAIVYCVSNWFSKSADSVALRFSDAATAILLGIGFAALIRRRQRPGSSTAAARAAARARVQKNAPMVNFLMPARHIAVFLVAAPAAVAVPMAVSRSRTWHVAMDKFGTRVEVTAYWGMAAIIAFGALSYLLFTRSAIRFQFTAAAVRFRMDRRAAERKARNRAAFRAENPMDHRTKVGLSLMAAALVASLVGLGFAFVEEPVSSLTTLSPEITTMPMASGILLGAGLLLVFFTIAGLITVAGPTVAVLVSRWLRRRRGLTDFTVIATDPIASRLSALGERGDVSS